MTNRSCTNTTTTPTSELLEATATRTENDALIEVTKLAAAPALLAKADHTIDDLLIFSVPEGLTIDQVDLREYTGSPRRKKGGVTLQDAPSFVAYVKRHKTASTQLYTQPKAGLVVAILNDHAEGTDAGAGWGDFRATLKVALTKEWEHWAGANERELTQLAFAEHLQKGETEIRTPPAATMLDLGQRFEATARVAFKSVRVLHDGTRQIQYEETLDAKAGERGEVKIPREFVLGIAPFEGSDPYEVKALLRYRIREEKLALSYSLVRPDDVLRAAFDDVLKAVEKGTGLTALRGTYGG